MLDEGPEGEDFVLTRKLNLHDNQRHQEDILDQVGGGGEVISGLRQF